MTTSSLLDTIASPAHLRRLARSELRALALELREYVLQSVGKTGGHLSSNLGTVELTIALHYVFNTPHDRIVWDVGHQTYPHKILTGRRQRMDSLRQLGGLGGFPRRDESEYDAFGTAHSSTSISAALGMAHAAKLKGEQRRAVAVIGDGALTGGMAFEAMNHAGAPHGVGPADVLVILNDNDMSISPPVGALNKHLARLISGSFYEAARQGAKSVLKNAAAHHAAIVRTRHAATAVAVVVIPARRGGREDGREDQGQGDDCCKVSFQEWPPWNTADRSRARLRRTVVVLSCLSFSHTSR